jgi:nitrile hydratase subunit alpha
MPNHRQERPHDREHDPAHSQLSEMELRVRAESVLTQKGYIEPAALDLLIEAFEKKIGKFAKSVKDSHNAWPSAKIATLP